MPGTETMTSKDRWLSEVIEGETRRLRNFIRTRVPNEADVEDVLQDVLAELVAIHDVIEPVRQAGAWLFRVARNRIIDRFRRQRPAPVPFDTAGDEAFPGVMLESLLASPEDGPEEVLARDILLEELSAALDELPPEQREIFLAHELEGHSFKELAEQTGLSVNTLLSRKHYAVRHLRERLRAIYLEYVTT